MEINKRAYYLAHCGGLTHSYRLAIFLLFFPPVTLMSWPI
jgi:hypothetical protein